MAIDTATLLQLRQPHLQPKQRTIAKIRRLGISRASRESTKPQNWRAQTNTELSSRAVDFYCEVATCPASAKFQQVTQTNDYSSLTMALATSLTGVLFVSPRAWPLPSTEVVRVPTRPTSNNSERISYFIALTSCQAVYTSEYRQTTNATNNELTVSLDKSRRPQ